MTGEQYKNAIAALGMTQEQAAEFLKVSLRTSKYYAAGEAIPEAVAMLLCVMVKKKISIARVWRLMRQLD
jgi:hypothetical protein